LKTFKLVLLSLSLIAALSACSLPGISSMATQPSDQNPGSSAPTITSILTHTQKVIITPTYTASTVIASPISTASPLNTPAWSAYSYTCELAAGGGTMTMNLAWTDRSKNEDGYKVYRDMKVIATLAPNSTSYVDVAYVATGEQLSYSVESFTKDWQARGSTITYGCQLLN
jgi:hypothetical protein